MDSLQRIIEENRKARQAGQDRMSRLCSAFTEGVSTHDYSKFERTIDELLGTSDPPLEDNGETEGVVGGNGPVEPAGGSSEAEPQQGGGVESIPPTV